MTVADILEYFKDINGAYNECTRYDDLKRMLEELEETAYKQCFAEVLDAMTPVMEDK